MTSAYLTMLALSTGLAMNPFSQPEPTGGGDAPSGSELVEVELIAELTAIEPGEQMWLAVHYGIKAQWHLYWRNPGNSGSPPSFEFEAPEGVVIGEAVWPAPMRKVESEILLSNIFEDSLTVLFPVALDAAYPTDGGPVTIRLETDWLVCKDICLPGSGSAEVTLEIGEGEPSARSEQVARAVRELPTPLEELEEGVLEAVLKGRTLVLEAPGAERLSWFAYESEVFAEPIDLIKGTTAKGGELVVEYTPEILGQEWLEGVVVIDYSEKSKVEEDRRRAVLVRIPVHTVPQLP